MPINNLGLPSRFYLDSRLKHVGMTVSFAGSLKRCTWIRVSFLAELQMHSGGINQYSWPFELSDLELPAR